MDAESWLTSELASFGCAACGQAYGQGHIRLIAQREELFFVDLSCEHCGSQAVAIVTIQIDGKTVHFLTSHPTPPVFDGPEDRNGTRNGDEPYEDLNENGVGDLELPDPPFTEDLNGDGVVDVDDLTNVIFSLIIDPLRV